MSVCVPELNLLRNVEANNQESGAAAKSSSLLSSFRSSSTYNHETETIFALPRMQLDFKSIHVQDPDEPSLTGGLEVSILALKCDDQTCFDILSLFFIGSRLQQAHRGVQRGDGVYRPHLRHHGRRAHHVPPRPGVRLPEGEGKRFFGSAFFRSFVRSSFGAASSVVNKTTGKGARARQRSLCAGGRFSGVRGTVISTLSGEVTAPNTLGMLIAFLLSESNKLRVSAEAAGHPP